MAENTEVCDVFQVAEEPADVVVKTIRRGLPADTFGQVADALKLSKEGLAKKLGIAARTITRKRSAKQKLSAEETEKILRVARVRNLAKELFNSDDAVSEWLAKPAVPLHNLAPIDLLDTDVGAREVEGFIWGLVYGNFQ